MDLWPLVLRDGDVVTASGGVVATPDGAWIQPDIPLAPIALVTPPPITPNGPLAVPVVGLDLAALEPRTERDGCVAARGTLTGTWDDGRILVTAQGPERLRPREELIAEALGKGGPPATVEWPDDVLDRLHADLDARGLEWQGYEWWTGNRDGHVVPVLAFVKVVRVHRSMAEWAESLPDALLDVRAWLTPTR